MSKGGFVNSIYTDFDFLDARNEPELIINVAESKEDEEQSEFSHDVPEYLRTIHDRRHRGHKSKVDLLLFVG